MSNSGNNTAEKGEKPKAPASSGTAKASSPAVKVVMQQCLRASLKIVANENEEGRLLEIGRGVVVYLCFSSGANEQAIDKAAKLVLSARLSEPSEDGTEASNQVKSKTRGRLSVVDLPGDVLVVPQATLGGRFKGTQPQYHSNCEASIGKQLYDRFVNALNDAVSKQGKRVEAGRYGARQPLSLETDGPYTHVMEF